MKFSRLLYPEMIRALQRGKSILLLGPRQTGKTTLLEELTPTRAVSLVSPRVRVRYEKDPSLLADEIRALPRAKKKPPLVIVDEIQKVPSLMDVAQELIDKNEAQFVLTGSSARKLKRGKEVNLLPGRVVNLRLDPLSLEENMPNALEEHLFSGALPGIRKLPTFSDKENDLRSYVETYLEEEVREEALVRNVGMFARFLELAGLESGKVANFSKISEDVGVSSVTIQSYYEILEDCLVAERVDPITKSATRKKLTKASRFILFDMGVRRLAANEGTHLHPERLGELFEQFIALEIIRWLRIHRPTAQLRFWRDPDGPEVDWVVEYEGNYFPIEAKWTERPTEGDFRQIKVFQKEYKTARGGYVVCRTPEPLKFQSNLRAIPWRELPTTLALLFVK